jgi:hypothetical protein
VTPLTRELLTRLEPAGILLDGVPEELHEQGRVEGQRFRIACPACRHNHMVPARYLGQSAKCKRCPRQFPLDWGEPVPSELADDAD